MYQKSLSASAPVGLWLFLALSLGASNGLAKPGKAQAAQEACVSAYEDAQRLRKDAQFRAAKEQLLTCAQPACGEFVLKECNTWLSELESAMPSLVFAAVDEHEQPLMDVEVRVDDELLASQLDGRAVVVDPGVHRFSFRSGKQQTEQRVVVFEGEKHRKIVVQFSAPKAPKREAKPDPVEAKPDPVEATPPNPTAVVEREEESNALPLVLGSAGLLGFVGFGTFGYIGKSEEKSLRECWPRCAPDHRSRVRTLFTAADLSLGVGVVSTISAVWIWLSRDSDPPQQDERRSASLAVDVQPSRHGVFTKIGGTF